MQCGAANPGCSRLSRRLRARPLKPILLLQSRVTWRRSRLKRRLQPGLAAPQPVSRKRVSTLCTYEKAIDCMRVIRLDRRHKNAELEKRAGRVVFRRAAAAGGDRL